MGLWPDFARRQVPDVRAGGRMSGASRGADVRGSGRMSGLKWPNFGCILSLAPYFRGRRRMFGLW